MIFLSFLPPVSMWMWALLDATLLIILLSPTLYFFVLRPLMLQISERKQAEEKTKLAYAELNQIFNTAADGMRLIDKDFNVLRVNETFSTLSGVNRNEAMRVFNENKDRIQLLILDVVMPKKNGKEVYDEIKKIRPDIKAIFTSGYNAEIIHKKGILEKGLGFITKPFLPQELLKKVREFLDST